MMLRDSTLRVFGLLHVLLAAHWIGCTSPPNTPDAAPTPEAAIAAVAEDRAAARATIELQAVAGESAFALGAIERSHAGGEYKVTKLRYYLSEPELVALNGATVKARLAAPDGTRMQYGVALVDHSVPSSLAVRLLAPAGTYKAVNLTIGVPDTSPQGGTLNHGDASKRAAPLDVDSDMYWSWNPGYVFLKIEGQVDKGNGSWKPFFYHLGNDRRAKLHVHVPLEMKQGEPARARFLVDVNQLFVTPEGLDGPNLAAAEREHGGPSLEQIASNASRSRFVRLAGTSSSPAATVAEHR